MPTGVVILVKTAQDISEEELNRLRSKFMEDMNLTKSDFYSFSKGGPLIRVTNKEYEIVPKDEKIFSWFDVAFWRSFYGIGYERGDIELYVRSAEWIEKNIPGSQVFYGSDAGDDSIVLFDETLREKLLQHYNESK